MSRLWVKICGLTREEDVDAALLAGASAIGLNLWPRSKRFVPLERARELAGVARGRGEVVLVFVDADFETIREAGAVTEVRFVQLHGREPSSLGEELNDAGYRVINAVRVDGPELAEQDRWPDTMVLLDASTSDAPGGTGRRVDWLDAAELAARHRVVLAGGLDPDNVDEAVVQVRPFGVDVASGVESSPGVKDHDRMCDFVRRAREAHR